MNIITFNILSKLIKRSSIGLILFSSCLLVSNNCYSQKHNYRIKTIVIDAGHGGKDPGALGKKVREKDIVLKIALKLGSYIEQTYPNLKVIYTRKTDVFIPLNERSNIANHSNADLFISIHANSNPNPKIRGTETYTLGLHKTQENLRVAMKENSVMLYEEDYSTKYEGFDPNNPASYIIFNLMQGVNRDKSIDLAELTEAQFKNRAGRHSRGVREAGFWVLKQVSTPSILVEVGFVSNPTEEKYLNTINGQDYLASAIYRAFKQYKNKIEDSSVVLNRKKIEKSDSVTSYPNVAVAKKNDSELIYCVQIKSSSKKIPLNSREFKSLTNIEERISSGTYKYTIGATDNYREIILLQRKIREKIKDCFVVAYYKGKRISLSKAKKLQKS
ncbi:N-acetylmuramoyl-L-alanine amidase family protein [Ancylomarina longa]|nr:N-acetylmuramoyl-L-alanine amidase [Ancylomarina longa]